MTPRPCGLMARKTNDDSHDVRKRALEAGSDLGFHHGTGDGNRTRTISLGIGQIAADEAAEQSGFRDSQRPAYQRLLDLQRDSDALKDEF